MISNLIVFSSLFLAILYTLLYLLRPGFRARVEQPKYAFLQQLSMYDSGAGSGQTIVQHDEHLHNNSGRVRDSDNDNNNDNNNNNQDKVTISIKSTEK